MKILVIGNNTAGSLETIYFEAFNRIQEVQVDFFNINLSNLPKPKNYILKKIINNRFTDRINHNKIHHELSSFIIKTKNLYDLIIIFKGMEFTCDFLVKLKVFQKRALWLNINPDDPFNFKFRAASNQNILDSIHFFDHYFIWSKKIAKQLLEYKVKNVHYLPFAYSTDKHPVIDKTFSADSDKVNFVGAWDKERESVLNHLSEFNLFIYGNDWMRAKSNPSLHSKIIPKNLYGKELSDIIASSAVSLNILRKQNYDAHNMRTFEIPAMNGLMLTTRSEEQNFFFPENEACYMFTDTKELKQKIKYILNHPEEAIEVRQNGHLLALKHTYDERAKFILDIIKQY